MVFGTKMEDGGKRLDGLFFGGISIHHTYPINSLRMLPKRLSFNKGPLAC